MAAIPPDLLETLLAVLDEGTFDAAAARLRVSPPAVSQRIKALEREAGGVLVRRTTPVTATAAAAPYLRHARRMRLLALELERELEREHRDAPSIAVAVNADSLATWFLPALAEAERETGAVFEVLRDDQDRTAELLRNGTVLAAVTAEHRPVQGCLSTPLGALRYVAVATPAFRDEQLGDGLSSLARARRVDFDRQDALQHEFLRRHGGGRSGAPHHLIPTSAEFARAIELGMGWGLLPEQQAAAGLADGRLVALAPDDPVDVPLHWQRWNLDSPVLAALTTAVERAARDGLRPPASTATPRHPAGSAREAERDDERHGAPPSARRPPRARD